MEVSTHHQPWVKSKLKKQFSESSQLLFPPTKREKQHIQTPMILNKKLLNKYFIIIHFDLKKKAQSDLIRQICKTTQQTSVSLRAKEHLLTIHSSNCLRRHGSKAWDSSKQKKSPVQKKNTDTSMYVWKQIFIFFLFTNAREISGNSHCKWMPFTFSCFRRYPEVSHSVLSKME